MDISHDVHIFQKKIVPISCELSEDKNLNTITILSHFNDILSIKELIFN